MNNARNAVQLIGNLGATPEIKNFENGKKLAKLSIATNNIYKDASGETVKHTQWHQVIAWGKTAEIIEKYLDKGSEVCIRGQLQSRSFEDKEGATRYITEVVAQNLLMMGKKAA